MATQNIFDLTDTWNNVATTFTAIKMNATDTASASGSLLIDLQVGGTSRFSVGKGGNAKITNASADAIATLTGASLIVENTDAGNTGVSFNLYHNSASPAVSDGIGRIQFFGNNSSAAVIRYVGFGAVLTDPTAGAESARFQVFTYNAGTIATRLQVGAGLYMNGATGGDQGANTINATALYTNGNQIADTNGLLRARQYTVATLPAASGAAPMQRASVSDALAPVALAAVVGGGAVKVPVYDDGAWKVG